MDREEKLLLMYVITAIFALLFYALDTNERMARAGYFPTRLTGDSSIYWYKQVAVDTNPIKF